MVTSDSKFKKSLIKLFRDTFPDLVSCEVVDVKESYRLPTKKIKVPIKEHPFQINLFPDGKTLHIYPEKPLAEIEEGQSSNSFILLDPDSYYNNKVSGFYRLSDGDNIIIGGKDAQQRAFLNIPKELPARKLSITNIEGELVFKSLVNNPQSCIAPLLKDKKVNQLINWRLEKLARIKELFGGPIELLAPEEALKLIREVNQIVQDEKHRPKDSLGKPGGVVHLPDKSTVVLLGDLHAKADNLLTLLSQNSYLEALENGTAFLIMIGDAVHPEGEVELDEMKSSMLMMDLIFKLKARFPNQVYYLRGNHDSFSKEIAKGGIPQGMLWEQALINTRGEEYRDQMALFYEQIPYLIYSNSFISCHAAAPISSIELDNLINIRQEPKLINELINNRLKRPSRPSGYSKGDVKRLKKSLGVDQSVPFIVGHTPLSTDETIWENVDDIKNHYILYSSDLHWLGVIAQLGDNLYPFLYPVEPVTAAINSSLN